MKKKHEEWIKRKFELESVKGQVKFKFIEDECVELYTKFPKKEPEIIAIIPLRDWNKQMKSINDSKSGFMFSYMTEKKYYNKTFEEATKGDKNE